MTEEVENKTGTAPDPAAVPQMGTEAMQEFSAIQTVHGALAPLSPEARCRVLTYIESLLDVDVPSEGKRKAAPTLDGQATEDGGEVEEKAEEETGKYVFKSFAELYDAASPSSNSEKAVVAGYWLQEIQGAESFDSQSVNKELKHLGHGIAHITSAFDSLKTGKPALALQLKKSGKSQQARKTYKLTVAGVNRVKEMTGG